MIMADMNNSKCIVSDAAATIATFMTKTHVFVNGHC